jgi:hypothetical protein
MFNPVGMGIIAPKRRSASPSIMDGFEIDPGNQKKFLSKQLQKVEDSFSLNGLSFALSRHSVIGWPVRTVVKLMENFQI